MPKPVAAAAPPRAFVLRLHAWCLVAVMAGMPPALVAGTDPGQESPPALTEAQDHTSEPPAEVRLTPEQRHTLQLRTEPLAERVVGDGVRAPGEVRLNAYATAQVTPRITAQVIARHARLGDRVAQGQPLVTLSSVELAEAQGDLVVAELEWGRLDRIRDKFVSDREYLGASVARQKARSRVLSFGMTQAQIAALLANAGERADGTFELLAPQAGTVIQDDFVQGELVQPGRVLFEITDESVRWVEAQLPPGDARRVAVGDQARVAYGEGGAWLEGRVTQIHHRLAETTRTQAVRIEVPDPGHRLHPGVFVDVVVLVGAAEPVLAIPEAAVLRSPDGDWQVFVAEGDDAFKPVEVELVRTAGGLAVIESLAPGTRVVTQGAFFLQSELAKAGFDPHNH
ncbi:MAG: efflux RND transporter periplasmic adaptor subunit [Thiobacillaceae bacterium]|jgi:RND family efflux transporter MFP subunit|nr:efflux RND transporter periplasmic adaptor subunit [Thiobacillaceae bacterium]